MCRTTRKTTDYKLNFTGKNALRSPKYDYGAILIHNSQFTFSTKQPITFMAAKRNFISGVP